MPEDHRDNLPRLSLDAIRVWAVRWRHVPLVGGWVIYVVASVIAGMLDGEALVLPSKLLDRSATLDLTVFQCLCVCSSPAVLIVGVYLPMVCYFYDLPVGIAWLVAAVLGASALTNITVGVWAFASVPQDAYILILWQSGLLLIALAIVPWDARYVRQYDILDCRACGYPLKPSIAGGSRSCPECGEAIPGVTFTAFDQVVARERRLSTRAVEVSPPSATPPPPASDEH